MVSADKVIAFYIGSLSRGGAERVMVNLAKFFHSEGYRVYLVTKAIDEPEYEVPEGVVRIVADITTEEESKSRVRNLLNRIRKLSVIWKEIKPDIIVSFIRKNNLMAIASSRSLKIPVVVSIRSNPARELSGKLFQKISFFMFRFADGIVMQTSQAKAYLPGYLQKKAVIMPNSLSEQFMQIEPDHNNRRQEIVLVGRIDDNKNQRMVLEVFSQIAEMYPDWSLHLLGDGDKRKELEELYGSKEIIFHGQVADVTDYMKNSAIFVLPSKQEGMPNALIEAMALGMACISTNCPCGGPADLIRDESNGILIEVDDKDALKESLIKLMSDHELRKQLGEQAQLVRASLDPKSVNSKWKNYIEGLLKA